MFSDAQYSKGICLKNILAILVLIISNLSQLQLLFKLVASKTLKYYVITLQSPQIQRFKHPTPKTLLTKSAR